MAIFDPRKLSPEFRTATSLMNEAAGRGMIVSYNDCVDWARRGFTRLVSYDPQPGLIEWCKNQYGTKNFSWSTGVMVFRNDEDAVMFKLLWGKE